MAGLSDAVGRHGAVEQLLLWGVLNQMLGAAQEPFLTALRQGADHAHPEQALSAEQAATLAARFLLPEGEARDEAARNGVNAERFAALAAAAKVRLTPASVAEALLRDYMTQGEGEAEVHPQGITPRQLQILADLAGDAIGPQDAARALLRGIIPEHGRGADSTSYEQAVAESRLHDKWGPILARLARELLSPPDAASAVVRNFLGRAEAEKTAAAQGVDAATFDTMTHLAADAPGPLQLAEALRRGVIPRGGLGPESVSFLQGIAEGRLADKWAPVIQALSQLWPTPTDALDAQVKGQLSDAQGRALYEQLGGAPQFHDWLLHSIGEGPTPLEAAAMQARGIIPEHGEGPESTSYDQAVRESRYRNKWTGAYRKIAEYLPAPGEIITFLAHNAITKERAAELLARHDVEPDVLGAFLNEAELTALSDYRGLTQSAVTDMYYARLIGHDLAVSILEQLHVTPRAAELLLSYADLRQVITAITKSVQRIGTLYIGRKISTDEARQALGRLEITAASVEAIIQDWELQALENVKILTAAEIRDAFYYGIETYAEALSDLQAVGYTLYDAWVYLSIKVKGPLPGKPARTRAAPAGQVIPGTA